MVNGRFRIVMLGLWTLTAGILVLSFLLGIPLAFQAITTLSGASALVGMARTATTALHISPLVYALYALFVRAIFVAVHLAIAVLLLRQRQRGWFVWFVAFYMVVFGATMTQEVVALGLTAITPFSLTTIQTVVNDAGWLLFVSFFFLFPNGRFVPRWTALALIVWFINAFVPMPQPIQIGVPLVAVGAQIYRYRRVSTVAERRQTKWVVFGFFLFMAASLAFLPAINRADNTLALEAVILGGMLLPLSIGVAMWRGQLWDVDVIIRKTLQYGLVTAVLIVVYFGSVTLLQSLIARTSGNDSPIVLVISTLLVAALVNPLRRRVQAAVDRRFFRQKYDAQQVLAHFARTARDEVRLEDLVVAIENVIRESMQPERVTLVLRSRGK